MRLAAGDAKVTQITKAFQDLDSIESCLSKEKSMNTIKACFLTSL